MAPRLEPIGSKLLYEDEGVRIWDNRIAPGKESAPHRHETDYVVVDVDGDRATGLRSERSVRSRR